MIAKIIGLSLFFLINFYCFLGNPYEPARGIQKTWAWNKESTLGMFVDPRVSFEPESILNGYKLKNSYIRIPEGSAISIDDSNRIEYPLISKGYLSYRKIGETVEFYSQAGEVLWTKQFSSYPRIHPEGNLILFLAGDNNQVLVSDLNGNLLGAQKLDGRYLTDIAYSLKSGENKGGAAVLFAGGELFLLDGSGNLLFSGKLGLKEPVFAKSLGLSKNGERLAVHFLKGNRDFIRVYDKNGSEISEWNLGRVLPHKIYLSVSAEGEVMVGFPDKLCLYDDNGKIKFEKKRSKSGGVYQTVFHSGNYFVGEVDNVFYFLDGDGVLLDSETFPASEKPMRFFHAPEKSGAFLESSKEIILFRELDRN
ncbi:hypothetical protein CH373_12625 [Leptospira perolatii]|uniref:Uncharacterized protein n=1 Tax=Leptospira perolatii TaxID=2023191 RepID=A0A2M9ZLK8_9LEPT|nr:hypothetical protein [Leptospira perolatii]PJZ70220.1 hypothetical protein CH360_06345 [Leptospira perolatii]PJZ72895.1 hypothetical protein CH373_12625 [Leptospira perolatii]